MQLGHMPYISNLINLKRESGAHKTVNNRHDIVLFYQIHVIY